MLRNVTDSPGIRDGPLARPVDRPPQIGQRQSGQEGAIARPHLAVISSDGPQIMKPAIVAAARAHGHQRRARCALPEDVRQVVVEHFGQVLEIPADGGDLRNRLPADFFGAKLLRGPVPYAPKISIQVVPQLHPGFDGGIHGALLAGSRRNRPHWSRLCPKKGVWNSSLNKCSSFERLKVPDTFFWAKPSG